MELNEIVKSDYKIVSTEDWPGENSFSTLVGLLRSQVMDEFYLVLVGSIPWSPSPAGGYHEALILTKEDSHRVLKALKKERPDAGYRVFQLGAWLNHYGGKLQDVNW